ncbi:MAG: crotonase/enoyl-CoA hydratase family protein [Deltaproteobacteria bacterium]|nr:crotonase/enoyl-CoA hydratase family protein [Deltaproteobacteria bacterium]MBW2691970.1 crotonase/enoyl-CoA hydratase family protein [Deltaproteobacteria bacterium]
MSDRVSISIDSEGIADVRLNRPDKMNACDLEMIEALSTVGSALAKDHSLRAVVLSGEGQAFCAGLDITLFSKFESNVDGLLERDTESPANFVQRAAWVWTELPVPVIAAVHGVAFGAGFQIALAADIRFVAPDARFSAMEIKWGLIPDMTGAVSLQSLVGIDVAKELVFTGRIVFGTEARELGLATHVSKTPRDQAFELARDMARRSPDAIRAAKQLLGESDPGAIEERLEREARLQRPLIGGPNQIEAVRANLERRAPQFEDPK